MPRFACDAMLGSLARWLRFFGYDSVYCDVTLNDEEVAELAHREGRWLLTRDRELASVGPPRTVLVREEELDEQICEVFRRFELRPEPNLGAARCAECNGELRQVSREAVAQDVPTFVLQTAVRFRRCRDCRRVYWPGTHGDSIVHRMEKVCQSL